MNHTDELATDWGRILSEDPSVSAEKVGPGRPSKVVESPPDAFKTDFEAVLSIEKATFEDLRPMVDLALNGPAKLAGVSQYDDDVIDHVTRKAMPVWDKHGAGWLAKWAPEILLICAIGGASIPKAVEYIEAKEETADAAIQTEVESF